MCFSFNYKDRLNHALILTGMIFAFNTSHAAKNISTNIIGDASSDLISVLVTNELEIYEGDGLGGFNIPQLIPLSVNPIKVQIGDMNSDGFKDLIIQDVNGDAFIAHNNQLDGFLAATQLSTGVVALESIAGLKIGDMNDDSYLDVILAINGLVSGRVAILYGDGMGDFAPAVELEIPGLIVSASSLNAVDINNDNSLDIVVKDQLGTVHTILSDGFGAYQLPNALIGALPIGNIFFSDYNHDQIPDMIVLDEVLGLLSLRLGDGDGTFGSGLLVSVGLLPTDLVSIDINYDGNKDIVVVNAGDNSINVLLGDGLGGIVDLVGSALTDIIGILPVLNLPSAVVSSDFNFDCRRDLGIWNELAQEYVVIYNKTGAEPLELIHCATFEEN